MTKTDLPEGVPADNQTKASFGGDDFTAPDMATPSFVRDGPEFDHRAKRVVREEYEEIVEEDDDEDEEETHHRPRPPRQAGNLAIMIAITALFAALGAIVIANNRSEVPLCSSQPAWNQYNCRAG